MDTPSITSRLTPIKAIDTLGAGDVFHGACVLMLAEGRDFEQALRFSAAAAAIKCTRFGGVAGAPSRQEVEAFLASGTPELISLDIEYFSI